MARKASPHLQGWQIKRAVLRRIKRYEGHTFLEQFALFMGKAQVLEFGLKQLLARLYGIELDETERWTLGRATRELKERGLRKDYAGLLEHFVGLRNFIAHELLLSEGLVTNLVGRTAGFVRRPLHHGIYEVEQALYLYDWCERHNAWQ